MSKNRDDGIDRPAELSTETDAEPAINHETIADLDSGANPGGGRPRVVEQTDHCTDPFWCTLGCPEIFGGEGGTGPRQSCDC
ncbi:MAG: hypothetical protein L0I76_13075 [Pseudonocardia sp.]|nr:hypothetical protein [Pseudonocardia sp.]